MRINYTLVRPARTGGSMVLYRIMNGLVERGHDVSVTLPNTRESLPDWLSPHVQVITPRRGLFLQASHTAIRAANILLRRMTSEDFHLGLHRTLYELERIMPDCDANVATFCLTVFPVFRSEKGIPFFHMQSDEELFFTDSRLKSLARESYYLPLNKIANSIWLRDQIQDRTGEEVPILNPGIDLDVFRPRRTTGNGARRRVVCYGHKLPLKGFGDAVEAMKLVFRARPDLEWLVFGVKPPVERSDEAPYTFVGSAFDDKLAELYSSADVVFSPSWLESFPLPPLEAMACGTPVVTTKPGTEDYCVHEENCLVVPAKEPTLLANAIIRLLEDQRLSEKLIDNGLRTAQRFTWENAVLAAEKLFQEKMRLTAP